MSALDVSLLAPPYHDAAPVIGRLPVLGAAAVARVDGPRGLSAELAALLERAPWTVPCVVIASNAVTAGVLQRVWELPGQPAFLILPSPSERIPATAVLAAIASRPVPPTSLLIAYLVRRTRSVLLGQTLDQICSGRNSGTSVSAERTVRHRLRRLGSYGRHDWIRILRLVRAKTEGHCLNVEQRAHLVGTEARTLRSWIARYLGTSMKVFRATAGWEWILEAALRRGNFELEHQPQEIRSDAALPRSAALLGV